MTREEQLEKENAELKEQVQALWKMKLLKLDRDSIIVVKGHMPVDLARKLKHLLEGHRLDNLMIILPSSLEFEALSSEQLARLGLMRVE